MYFSSSKALGRVPLTLVCGEHVALRRTFINRLLAQLDPNFYRLLAQRPEAANVYPHLAVRWFEGAIDAVDEDCLCCGLRSGLGDALSSMFLSALSARGQPLERVLIDAGGIRSAQLRQTLKHTPFLGQRFVHQATIWVVDPSDFDATRLNDVLFGISALSGRPNANPRSAGCVVVHQPLDCGNPEFEAAFSAIQRATALISPEISVVRLSSETLATDLGRLATISA